MHPFYRNSIPKVNPNDRVGGGTFGEVYGCIVQGEEPPCVVKEVVVCDMKSYYMTMNEIAIQNYVAERLGLAPKITRVDFSEETVSGKSPSNALRIVNIYQDRMDTTLMGFIEALLSAKTFPLPTIFAIIRTLLRRVAEAAARLNPNEGAKILHGDLGPSNVLIDADIPKARACALKTMDAVQKCRVMIIDYGYSAEYQYNFLTRLSGKFSNLRYYHTFPVWYDRAFLLFTTVGLCATRLSLGVADVLRRLAPDWISREVFDDAIKKYATKDRWQWCEIWETYRIQYALMPEKRDSETLSISACSIIIEEGHDRQPLGTLEETCVEFDASNHSGSKEQPSRLVSLSGNPFWAR